MSKRINPIRNWSIMVFVMIAVCTEALLLPTIAHYGGWNVDPKTPRDLEYTGSIISLLLMLQLLLWIKFLNFIQDWREKRG